ITNIVQNAIKYSPERSEIRLRCGLEPEGLAIEVEDQCGGLAENVIDDLFRPFVRGAATDAAGLGLGLAIARQAVEGHGGAITVRNLPGKGCVFVVRIPALS